MSKFTLFIGKNSQYYFNLKAGNNEIILQSEGYKAKQSALNGINSVRDNSPNDNQYVRKIANNNEPYFVLKAKNGEIIGVSETYSSAQMMDKGIESVKRNGQTSIIDDLTEEDVNGHIRIIIVNGREKEWNKHKISFEEVVKLAFDNYVNDGRTVYTVTYTRGQNEKPQGSMVVGDVVKVKHKMNFNVTATDKS